VARDEGCSRSTKSRKPTAINVSLLRLQRATRVRVIWEMNGTSIIGGAVLPNSGPSWRIIGTGDFNGDGKSDILWQNTDGLPFMWEMNGTSIIGAGALPNQGAAWQIKDDGPVSADQMATAVADISPPATGGAVHLSAPDLLASSAVPALDDQTVATGSGHFLPLATPQMFRT
jgi:hypothetical protein